MKKIEFQTGWNIFLTAIVLALCVWALYVSSFFQTYHDECISSHVEVKYVYIPLPQYCNKFPSQCPPTTKLNEAYSATPLWNYTETICDKYALVRNATENGQ